MPHHCPFPVRSTDNRRCYRIGSAPGFTILLALLAALLGYAGFSHADASDNAQANEPMMTSAVVGATIYTDIK